MARSKQDAKMQERTRLIVPLKEAQERVKLQLDRGRATANLSINENDEAKRWYDFTAELLRQISSTDELQDEFTGRGDFSFGGDISTGHYLKKLLSLYEKLELLPTTEGRAGTAAASNSKTELSSRRVFVVHGHDDGTKETVARFLGKLDLEPVILHEQPNRGRTVIEKFEDYSDVAFAVVLFTPDDIGHAVGKEADAKPRARQNVVLELGFFMAALGRANVCVLYKGGVEIPSDYSGVLYEELDGKGTWRFRLAAEMKACGLDVDLNKAV
ncbi:TIR domain-containing protein [Hydrogenophaga sp.]|uniref:TIR domain-containing protein n=1 Tax=Hydrogenophaga sp. TaxID=1904254 RepID=UPI003F6FF1D0